MVKSTRREYLETIRKRYRKAGKKDKLWAAITIFGGLFNINSFWYNLTTVLTRLIEIFCLIERI